MYIFFIFVLKWTPASQCRSSINLMLKTVVQIWIVQIQSQMRFWSMFVNHAFYTIIVNEKQLIPLLNSVSQTHSSIAHPLMRRISVKLALNYSQKLIIQTHLDRFRCRFSCQLKEMKFEADMTRGWVCREFHFKLWNQAHVAHLSRASSSAMCRADCRRFEPQSISDDFISTYFFRRCTTCKPLIQK